MSSSGFDGFFLGLCRFSHSLDEPRPTRTPRPPPEACWFCLSSPNIDTHLVVSVGDHCYCALAKGPLCAGHVLVLPIEHQPSTISLSLDAQMELEKYKYAIRECFRAQGKAAIFFERYLQLRAGTHAHLQVLLTVIVLVISLAIYNCLEPELEFFLF